MHAARKTRPSGREPVRPATARGGRARVAAVLLVLAAGCELPTPLTAGLFSRPAIPPIPAAADCERCHQEVYLEWKGSLHARATTHPAFVDASAGGRAVECLGCHAAAPVEAGVAPRTRTVHAEEGVTCVTCHLSPDPDAAPLTMRGPEDRTSPVQIHPVVEGDPLYRSSALCGTCHEAAFREWRAAPEPAGEGGKPTCQGCHMPPVRRKMESVHDEHAYSALFVALGAERALRRHRFDLPELPAEGIRLDARLTGGGDARRVEVEVRNDLPHALPTGDYGRREVRLRVVWPGGERVASRRRRLGDALPGGARWRETWVVPPDVPAEDFEVRLERWDHREQGFGLLASRRPEGSPAPPGEGS